MKALFVTSETNDVASLVSAWDFWNEKSTRVTFYHMGENNDVEILAVAKAVKPDVIFYIGSAGGTGMPTIDTFLILREIAKSINLVCDGTDPPWHPFIREYAKADCFDLQVTLDGNTAPVDLITITPVDPRPYNISLPKTIHCGFSGNASPYPKRRVPMTRRELRQRFNPLHGLVFTRDIIVRKLEMDNILVSRRRTKTSRDPIEGSYSEHVEFMLSCRILLNTSISGSESAHQIKGRVLEAGWARCALLESEGSPIAEWMSKGSYFIYKDVSQAAELIRTLTDQQIDTSARLLADTVRTKYTAQQIYGEILERAGVDHPITIPTA